ncbi:MAG TPA: RagB/SusD family nutrient uptake outer membrane protein, partial [Niabella sp.]|nr:RagB/SusD family nutrient uptake outer membrane protein [Niabella sp.]
MNRLIPIVILASLMVSCQKSKFLDDKTNLLDDKAIFTDSIRTLGFLNRIYVDIGYTFAIYRFSAAGGAGNTELASDNAEGNNNTSVWGNAYAQGSIGPSNVLTGFAADKDFWNTPYMNIRRVNLLLARLPDAPFHESTKVRMAAEARFLRAWYYYQMIAVFGGVPVIDDNVYDINDIINIPRNSFEECVNYITSELDYCAQALANVVYADIDYGRITAGACMALKSRVLLYAASPLFNGGNSANAGDKA